VTGEAVDIPTMLKALEDAFKVADDVIGALKMRTPEGEVVAPEDELLAPAEASLTDAVVWTSFSVTEQMVFDATNLDVDTVSVNAVRLRFLLMALAERALGL
jgi:hypothetical protein